MRLLKSIAIGAVINTAFILIISFVHHLFPIRWGCFFDVFWFFILVLFPCVFLLMKNKGMAVGALLGIPLYYLICILILVVPLGAESDRADEFIEQCLVSINNDTDFYKDHSTEEAVRQIQNYRSMISNNYEILGNRMPEWGQRYYYISFDDTHNFELFVTGFSEFTLRHFFHDYNKNKVRNYVDPSLKDN